MSGTHTDDTAPRQELGLLLREAREVRGLSVRGAAAQVNISGTYLSQLEAGSVKDPSPRILFKLSEVYQVPYADLMRAAGYMVPGAPTTDGQVRDSHPLDVALRTTASLTEDERRELMKYLAWYRARYGRSSEADEA